MPQQEWYHGASDFVSLEFKETEFYIAICPLLRERKKEECKKLFLLFCWLFCILEAVALGFVLRYPAYKSGQLNISELVRVCDLSRTTIYKYIDLLEG